MWASCLDFDLLNCVRIGWRAASFPFLPSQTDSDLPLALLQCPVAHDLYVYSICKVFSRVLFLDGKLLLAMRPLWPHGWNLKLSAITFWASIDPSNSGLRLDAPDVRISYLVEYTMGFGLVAILLDTYGRSCELYKVGIRRRFRLGRI